MKKNTASQVIGAQMIDASDGSAFTGTVSVSVTIDGGTFTAGAGTAPAHEGGGYHSYTPTQAETNGTQVAFTFSGTGAISSTIQVYTNFPQTADNATLLTAIDSNVDQVLIDVADVPTVSEFNARTLLSTDYFNAGSDPVANVTTVSNTVNLTNLPSIPANWLTAAGIATSALDGKGDWNIGKTGYSISGAITTLDGLENIAASDIVTGGTITITSGLVDANAAAISNDTGAADNLEAMYDGTGYVNDAAPSTQSQVGSLSVGSAAISTSADSGTPTIGTEVNDYTFTSTVDQSYHEIDDDGGAMDIYYEFNVGGSGTAVEAIFTGRVNGGNDDVDVYAYDWDGAAWDQVGTIQGINGSTDSVDVYNLLIKHTGTAGDLGKVRIRFYQPSGLTSATLYVDQLIASYAVVTKSVGYANGAVWVDTLTGTSGIEPYVNGTADNPSDSYANATSIATSVVLHRYQVVNGSVIQFIGSQANESWSGTRWELDLNGQDLAGSFILGACISGIATGTTPPHLEHCEVGDTTLPPCRINGGSGFTGTLTLGSTGQYDIVDCNALIATPIIDLVVAGGPNTVNIRGWEGAITFNNVTAGDSVSLEGVGGVITVNGTGGTVKIRGIFEEVVDNSGGSVDIVQIAMLNRSSLVGYELGAVYIDTLITNTNEIAYVDGTADNPVSTIDAAVAVSGKIGNGLNTYYLNKGSSIALNQAFTATVFTGIGGTIDLAGQSIAFATFSGQNITGVGVGTGRTFWENCRISGASLNSAAMLGCSLNGTINLTEAEDYSFNNCYGTSIDLPLTINFSSTGDQEINFNNWDGNMTVANMGTGTDNMLIHGRGEVTIAANCTGGTITIGGDISVVDLASGAVTVNRTDLADVILDIQSDTNVLQTEWANGGRLDDILDARMPTTHIDATAGSVDNVTLVDTTTDYTNFVAPDNAGITANGVAIGNLQDISVADILTTQMTEAYAADNVAPTLAQALFLIQQTIGDFDISGTTITTKQLDGSTTAATYTLDDSGSPTSRTRTT